MNQIEPGTRARTKKGRAILAAPLIGIEGVVVGPSPNIPGQQTYDYQFRPDLYTDEDFEAFGGLHLYDDELAVIS